ncbi:hypothetical protein LZ30DRAFT_291532 [Colletotrichum cereale]|nr:hypothetical protein LZ30DRAFT_291532 [Colletotrichum cereale]
MTWTGRWNVQPDSGFRQRIRKKERKKERWKWATGASGFDGRRWKARRKTRPQQFLGRGKPYETKHKATQEKKVVGGEEKAAAGGRRQTAAARCRSLELPPISELMRGRRRRLHSTYLGMCSRPPGTPMAPCRSRAPVGEACWPELHLAKGHLGVPYRKRFSITIRHCLEILICRHLCGKRK